MFLPIVMIIITCCLAVFLIPFYIAILRVIWKISGYYRDSILNTIFNRTKKELPYNEMAINSPLEEYEIAESPQEYLLHDFNHNPEHHFFLKRVDQNGVYRTYECFQIDPEYLKNSPNTKKLTNEGTKLKKFNSDYNGITVCHCGYRLNSAPCRIFHNRYDSRDT